MRGRRRTLASALGDALAGRREAQAAALPAAVAEALGPRLAREVSVRGLTREGRLMLVVRSAAWAAQVSGLADHLAAQVNARLGREVVRGVDVHAAPER